MFVSAASYTSWIFGVTGRAFTRSPDLNNGSMKAEWGANFRIFGSSIRDIRAGTRPALPSIFIVSGRLQYCTHWLARSFFWEYPLMAQPQHAVVVCAFSGPLGGTKVLTFSFTSSSPI